MRSRRGLFRTASRKVGRGTTGTAAPGKEIGNKTHSARPRAPASKRSNSIPGRVHVCGCVCVPTVKLVYTATRKTKPAFVLSASLGVILSLPLSRECARHLCYFMLNRKHRHMYLQSTCRRIFTDTAHDGHTIAIT